MTSIQEEILTTVRMSQDVIIEALQTWGSSVKPISLPLPGLSLLPAPEALVAGTFDFAGQLLATQRDFATDLIEAVAPLAGHGGA